MPYPSRLPRFGHFNYIRRIVQVTKLLITQFNVGLTTPHRKKYFVMKCHRGRNTNAMMKVAARLET
jgi:hypothetical protein